jgi:hypothetical protein
MKNERLYKVVSGIIVGIVVLSLVVTTFVPV